MGTTVNDLFRRTKTILDETVDNIDLVDWFNQCQHELSDTLYFPKKTTILKSGNGFPVPDDFNGELYITTPSIAKDYYIADGLIYIDSDYDDYTEIAVTYNRLPTLITNDPSSEPEIPNQFRSVYVFYAAMMFCNVDEEPERKATYTQDYLRLRRQIETYYGKLRNFPTKFGVQRRRTV